MSANLFLQHPKGHETTVPCTHLRQKHPNGDKKTVPCTHGFKQAHPYDRITVRTPLGNITKEVPCIHLVPKHPNGDKVTVPCIHFEQEHPNGDPGPTIPCVHPMVPTRIEMSGALLFYTNDRVIQDATINAVNRLRFLGINILWPRPLHIFHREPMENGDSNDPFWHHYDPLMHAIQIMKDERSASEKRETLYHEMGHALVGHSMVNRPGVGPHRIKEQTSLPLAMSEGWAHFVALVLSYAQNTSNPRYYNLDWENMDITPNPSIEYCVGCCLWDIYDRRTEEGAHPDNMALPFTELFKVYSPTLETLTSAVMVDSIESFLERLKMNNPDNEDLAKRIDQVKMRNVLVNEEQGVTVFVHSNYRGAFSVLPPGNYNHNQLGIPNDSLSSLRVPPGYRVTLFEHTGLAGRNKIVSSDLSYIGDDFNDITSSIKVERV